MKTAMATLAMTATQRTMPAVPRRRSLARTIATAVSQPEPRTRSQRPTTTRSTNVRPPQRRQPRLHPRHHRRCDRAGPGTAASRRSATMMRPPRLQTVLPLCRLQPQLVLLCGSLRVWKLVWPAGTSGGQQYSPRLMTTETTEMSAIPTVEIGPDPRAGLATCVGPPPTV